MIVKTFTTPRIIKGVFTQLQQSSLDIVIEDTNCSFRLKLLSHEGPAGYILDLEGGHELTENVTAVFWLEGEFYRCALHKLEESRFLPPSQLEVINRRNAPRINTDEVSQVPIVALLLLPGRRIFGEVESSGKDFISISSPDIEDTLELGSKGTLQSYLDGRLIGHHSIEITEKRTGNKPQLVLRVENLGNPGSRWNVRGGTRFELNASLFWPDEHGLSTPVVIDEVTGLGASGAFSKANYDVFPVGTIFLERFSGTRLRLAWQTKERVGFSFDTSDPNARSRFSDYLDRSKSGVSVRGSAKQALGILTKGGLLKGDRAISYANNSKRELLFSRGTASRRWFLELAGTEEYISFVRISDHTWLIQELTSIAESKSNGPEIIFNGIRRFCEQLYDEIAPSTAVIGIYDTTSKFNLEFWRRTLPEKLNLKPATADVTLGSIKSCVNTLPRTTESKLIPASSSSWIEVYEKLFNISNSQVHEAFGLSKNDYKPRVLAEILLNEGKRLERDVRVVIGPGDKPLGIAMKTGLPPLANATSLVENLFLFPSCETNVHALCDAIFWKENPFLIGVEDVCMIGGGQESTLHMSQTLKGFAGRSFEMTVIDLRGLRAERD